MKQVTKGGGAWWGERSLEEAETLHAHLGLLQAWFHRGSGELAVTYRHGAELRETPLLEQPSGSSPPDHGDPAALGARYAFRNPQQRLQLAPALPPRPLVVHTASPLVIPGGEEVTVFIGLPLWLRVSVGDETLMDAALIPLSDTWFGAVTGPGELCYASHTRGCLRLEDVPATPLRARAAIHIRNAAAASLSVDGLRLPAPTLSLFVGPDGQLWTESVLLDHEQDGEMAALDFGNGPPREAAGARRVVGPRSAPGRRVLVRTFSGLIQGGFDVFRHGRSRSSGMVDH